MRTLVRERASRPAGSCLRRLLSGRSLSILGTLLAGCILTSVATLSIVAGKDSPSGRVRLLYMGTFGGPGQTNIVFQYLNSDPFFTVTPIPALAWDTSMEDFIHRYMRLYLPKTYEDLVEDYDALAFFYASYDWFEPGIVNWLSKSVLEEGKGLFFMGVRDGQYLGHWVRSSLGDALPIDHTASSRNVATWIKALDVQHPLITSLPWSELGEHAYLHAVSPCNARHGAQVLGQQVTITGEKHPFLAAFSAGKGQTFAVIAEPPDMVYFPFVGWDFFPDFLTNAHLLSVGREIPTEPELVHRVRGKLWDLRYSKVLVLSELEFLSKLGGNTASIDSVLRDSDATIAQVKGLYLDLEFSTALGLLGQVEDDLKRGWQLAAEEKNRTLAWIYFIEWSVLSTTSLVAGVTLWSLMIRKRLYREVEATRLARAAA